MVETFRRSQEKEVRPGIPLSHALFILGDMTRQLVLIEDKRSDWRLDERTREVGKLGLAQAREALREATKRSAA